MALKAVSSGRLENCLAGSRIAPFEDRGHAAVTIEIGIWSAG